MEKAYKLEEGNSSLTSFNFIPEGDEEGLISKIFSKFKTAVSGPNQQQPLSPTQTVPFSNETSEPAVNAKIPVLNKIPPTPAANENAMEINKSQPIPTTPLIPLTKTSSIDSDTQSVMTTFSVSNTNSLSRILNRLRGSEPSDNNKEFWMPDEQCKECVRCNAPFNLFRRKHHCRTCGRIFCSKCLSNNIHTSQSLRVCNDCYVKYMEGYRADDTISLHDGYSYSSIVDNTMSSSLHQQQQQQQKTLLIPSGDDDESSDEELQLERSVNSFDLQRPPNLELHFSQSTSSLQAGSDSEIGIKKLLTNTFLRGAPRSRTSTMNSLGIDTSVAALESVKQQQQMNSPMPFRRNSFLTSVNTHQDINQKDMINGSPLAGQIGGTVETNPSVQPNNDFFEVEDDDIRRWDKNPRNLLNFLGGGNGERPSSGIFNNIPTFFSDDYMENTVVPVQSTSTSTIGKASSWFIHRPLSYTNNERSSMMRRRLSLTDGTSSNSLMGGSSNGNNISGSPTSSPRHVRVRTKSLMRNNLMSMSEQMENGYESSGGSGSNRNSFHQQQLTSSISTPTASANRSVTPDMEQMRILSSSSTHPATVVTHEQWDSSYIQLAQNIIHHLLDEAGLPRQQWEDIMLPLLLKIADEVQPNIRIRDTFNMNHYIKVKKVPGGLPQDSFYVNGVVFSKNVAHKGMTRSIKNPSILILNFDLDGFGAANTSALESRQEYLKFERLLAWERDHMNALVLKIVGLKPSVVLFSSNVPRSAIECLNKHKIVVAYNVKKQKLDAIARCTDATVFNYKNELWNAKTIPPSKCGLFEPMTIMHEYLPNRRKTFLMFHDCPKERGATIVLRGGDLKLLHIVKFIMNFMVKVVNNINLEAQLRKEFATLRRWYQPTYLDTQFILQGEDSALIDQTMDGSISPQLRAMNGKAITVSSYNPEADPMHTETQSLLSVAESQVTVNTIDVNAAKKKSQQQYQQSTVVVEDDDICLTAVNSVLKLYQTTILSISPGVTLPVPHILLKLKESQKKLIGLIRERLGPNITGSILASTPDASTGHTPVSPSLDEKQLHVKPIIPPIPIDLMHMPDYLKAFDAYLEHDLEYRHYQELHLQSWLLFKKYIGGIHQYLSPIYHQQILVRRTTNPMDNHTIPCEKAALDPYDYYNPMGDCTLGQYILNSTKEAYTKCSSKMCEGALIFHDRTYSHGNAQIKVQIYVEDDNGEDELIEEKVDISRDEYLRKIPIFMGTHCNICNVAHDWRPMSDLLQRYSFGKFLELLFYQSEPVPLFDEDEGDYFSRQGQMGCPHGFYRDHTISFRIQNLSVNFTHAIVKVVEVQPPPLHLRYSSKQQMAIKDAALDSTRSKIAKFFDSIIERNKQFSYDIVQPNMIELCKEYLQEMSQEAIKSKKNLLQKLQMEYATSAPTDTLQMNNVMTELQNHAVSWDLKYMDFARRFIRPERELRRLTTNHLRRMFPAESLYSSSSTSPPAVSNLSLRTKRAIEATDLPLLDVGLDQDDLYESSEAELSERLGFEDQMLGFKEQPTLGESPTESYPWYDELKRFDQLFLQDGKENVQEDISSSVSSSLSYSYHSHRNSSRRKSLSIGVRNAAASESSAKNLLSSSPSGSKSKLKSVDQDTRDLDPSVARRLSLELMKDAPKKKKEQQQMDEKKPEKKSQKQPQESRIARLAPNPSPLKTTPSTPLPRSTVVSSNEVVNESQSKLIRQAAALPLLSSTTYKRLAGLLPDPMVGKSKSSPSPGNYLPSQQKRAIPYQKLIENKTQNRKPQFQEPAMVSKESSEIPSIKTNFYRGSPYATKTQDRSTIAYRYGFMGSLNNTVSTDRRLGTTGITNPISTAMAAAAAASASASAAATATAKTTTSPTAINKISISTVQDLTIARPRSRTMAIVGNSNSSSIAQQALAITRINGRTSTSSTSNNSRPTTHKVSYSNSLLPLPTSNRYQQNGQLSEGKIPTRIRQRLPSKASLEPYTKIKEIINDDESCFSSSSEEEDESEELAKTVHDSSNALSDEEDDEEGCDEQRLLPFQHRTFSLNFTDEYDEYLGREVVPNILELEQFHQEHQLQMSKNTLPFLSVESGMVSDRKNDHIASQLGTKSNSVSIMETDGLLRSPGSLATAIDSGSNASNIDWSTNTTGRNSIMKAITYVLAEKSINNLAPLEYPFSPNEHIFADSNILVREDEPSSIISYMLGSTFYNEKLQKKQELRMSKASNLFDNESKEKQPESPLNENKSFFSEMFPETDERERPWRFSFQGGSTSFTCKIYFAEQFDMLRKSCGCDEIFISSLARCTNYNASGGKSGSIFLKTKDERFLIKQISKYEMDAFLGSANKYFMYMFNEVFDKGIPTVLCKIFGLYRIGFYNNLSGKSMKMDILVMENLFYDTSVKRVYDLKGSMRNRYAEKTGKEVEVFLDENLVEIISKTPLYMRVDTKYNLSDSLYNDTQFLLSLDVMDYSLLVGFDEDSDEIVVGIVGKFHQGNIVSSKHFGLTAVFFFCLFMTLDFIRTFTWDKKLESWVKESGMLGGGKKDPTIVSPRMYRKRFRSAIDLYFCMIPDFWTLILD
ncbi:hypothetical protein BD560DRAFT_491198 [Blakeslea trispora]|nr:hypothetical protein BD560DRAFT_491198 [Blakeslea trispora]